MMPPHVRRCGTQPVIGENPCTAVGVLLLFTTIQEVSRYAELATSPSVDFGSGGLSAANSRMYQEMK
jgi:hypothetical protein